MAAFNHQSIEWRTTSLNYRRGVKFRCEGCGRDCIRERGRLVAHHALGAKRFPEFAHDPQWLAALCSTCHDAIERCIRYRKLAELVHIGCHPHEYAPITKYGPVPFQFDLTEDAANEDFTLDPPIEVEHD